MALKSCTKAASDWFARFATVECVKVRFVWWSTALAVKGVYVPEHVHARAVCIEC